MLRMESMQIKGTSPLSCLAQAVGTRGIPEDIQGAVRNQGELRCLQLPASACLGTPATRGA